MPNSRESLGKKRLELGGTLSFQWTLGRKDAIIHGLYFFFLFFKKRSLLKKEVVEFENFILLFTREQILS